jgi:hypothetical protein
MANGIFNISKGRFVEDYIRVDGNDPAASALVIVLLKATGLEADDTLNNHDDLAALLAAANDEADFTNYARKVLTDTELSAIATPDDTNNRRDVDIPDQTWTAAGGATNNNLGKFLVCIDMDTGAGTDSNIRPISYHDFTATTDGNDLVAVINAAGFARAA